MWSVQVREIKNNAVQLRELIFKIFKITSNFEFNDFTRWWFTDSGKSMLIWLIDVELVYDTP